MIPGEIITEVGDIDLNVGRRTQTLSVSNTGDRPIQVGSHYHFYETNAALHFARETARGMRLNIAAGTAVRFEPGQSRTVELVDFAGTRVAVGFRGLVMGALDAKKVARATKASTAKKTPTAKKPIKLAAKKGSRK